MKKKKILLIILPIILILIIATVLAILYFMTDIFRSNDELFAKYFSQNGELFDIIQNANTEEQNTFKANNTYIMSGDLTTTIQDGTNIQEIKATTSARHDLNTGRTYSDITLKNGEADLLKVSYINSDDVYAIKCDDIMSNYIGIRNSELKKFAQNMGMAEADTQNIPDSVDLVGISNIGKITEEQKQHIIDTYSKVISENISKEKFTKLNKAQILVDGINYETNVYQLTIDENILKQIIINCLTTLKDDNSTLVMISNKLSTLGLGSEDTDITKLSETIENLATQMQNENETSENNTMTITVYENKGKTVRTEIELINKGKITIDKVKEKNTEKAIITVENNNTSSITDITMGEATTTDISQITIQKSMSDTNIINAITVIPDTSNTAQSITINTNMGKLMDNTINSSSDITLNISSDGINVQTIQSLYTQNIQATTEVDEIMELKNSNTIIVNNYQKEQLIPFLTKVGEKISQVLPNKLEQLGISLSMKQNENGITTNNIANTTNTIYSMISMIGTAGINIANANGVDMQGIVGTGTVGIGIYIYKSTNSIIERTQEAQQQIEQQIELENQMVENVQAQFDNIIEQYVIEQ